MQKAPFVLSRTNSTVGWFAENMRNYISILTITVITCVGLGKFVVNKVAN